MQVVVEYPVDRQAPVGCAVVGRGKFAGVLAKQVMQREPAGSPLGEQMSTDQVSQFPAGLRQRHTGQACRGGRWRYPVPHAVPAAGTIALLVR